MLMSAAIITTCKIVRDIWVVPEIMGVLGDPEGPGGLGGPGIDYFEEKVFIPLVEHPVLWQRWMLFSIWNIALSGMALKTSR